MYSKFNYFIFLFIIQFSSIAQEGIPVYSDYLTDNYYLLHPSMAGAGSCDKLRITGRKQWFGIPDAPELQTISLNMRLNQQSGAGIILYNDQNGYHSQKGAKFTYAHHIMFSRDDVDLNQLSFGMSAGLVQRQLDQTSFYNNGLVIKGQSLNLDFGVSYNFLNFYAHATVLSSLESKRSLYSEAESANLRRYIFSTGYAFGDIQTMLWEPSVMFQMTDLTKEKSVDINLKVHKQLGLDLGAVWGGISYRRSFEGAQYFTIPTAATTTTTTTTTTTATTSSDWKSHNQKLQSITPFLGITYKQFMVSYTYSKVLGSVLFDSGAYHQITLGFNFNCKQVYYIGGTL